jgi:AraC-like DNA-binding protein
MLTVYSTATIKEADRFEFWHQLSCRYHSITECERIATGPFDARMAVRPFGSLQLSSVASSSYGHIRYQRNALEIRKDSIDNFSFLFVSRGEIGAAQQQREASVGPGDMMMYHQASPFTLNASTGGVRAIIVSIPPALLTARVPDAHKLTARRLRNEPGRLAGKMFRQLIQSDIPSDSATAKRLGSAALDVLATALETEMEGPQPQATRQLDAVKQFIRDNLHDPSLDAERIAIANNIAPRTLNRLFAVDGSTPIRWLWQQRLVASYAAIAEGHVNQVTDAAMNCGFNDLSHFSRAFRKFFGCSPQSLKVKHLRSH